MTSVFRGSGRSSERTNEEAALSLPTGSFTGTIDTRRIPKGKDILGLLMGHGKQLRSYRRGTAGTGPVDTC